MSVVDHGEQAETETPPTHQPDPGPKPPDPPPQPTINMGRGYSPEAEAWNTYIDWCTLTFLGGEDDFEQIRQFNALIKFAAELSALAAEGRRTPLRSVRDRGLKPAEIAKEVELDPSRIAQLIKQLDADATAK